MCKIISGDTKGTLGKCLGIIEKTGNIEMHPALKEAFSKLYGYTNDADGIRHALLDEDKLTLEDAKFMLISSSAFINYLMVKADRAKIKLY